MGILKIHLVLVLFTFLLSPPLRVFLSSTDILFVSFFFNLSELNAMSIYYLVLNLELNADDLIPIAVEVLNADPPNIELAF